MISRLYVLKSGTGSRLASNFVIPVYFKCIVAFILTLP